MLSDSGEHSLDGVTVYVWPLETFFTIFSASTTNDEYEWNMQMKYPKYLHVNEANRMFNVVKN